jgi:methylenetetrahydrofolate dehydrogenase (NADP+)/methenyltetrahydrofolate cyclohydrolase
MMSIIDGRLISSKLKEEYREKISKLEHKPFLAMIRIGDDPASEIYVRNKGKLCGELGIPFSDIHLKSEITQEELLEQIDELNSNDEITGILVESPIPSHLNIQEVFDRILPRKDVDGLNSLNLGNLASNHPTFIPATPFGIMTLLKEYKVPIDGKRCVVVGRSNLVGRPMALCLLNANGTVTVCHSRTKNLGEITKQADILVVAIGKPQFIKADMIKDGAVVIDVGINRIPDSKKIVGDVDFENAKDKCEYITPVPGGVGPMTIISLIENLIKTVE